MKMERKLLDEQIAQHSKRLANFAVQEAIQMAEEIRDEIGDEASQNLIGDLSTAIIFQAGAMLCGLAGFKIHCCEETDLEDDILTFCQMASALIENEFRLHSHHNGRFKWMNATKAQG